MSKAVLPESYTQLCELLDAMAEAIRYGHQMMTREDAHSQAADKDYEADKPVRGVILDQARVVAAEMKRHENTSRLSVAMSSVTARNLRWLQVIWDTQDGKLF